MICIKCKKEIGSEFWVEVDENSNHMGWILDFKVIHLDCLKKQFKELKDDIKIKNECLTEAHNEKRRLNEELKRQARRIQELKNQLQEYSDHTVDCDIKTKASKRCTCGFSKLVDGWY